MFSRFFSRPALGKFLLPATQSRPTTVAPSLFKHNARIGTPYDTPDFRKITPQSKRPISIERTSLISGQLVTGRRVIGDAVGLQYLRYLPVAVPKPAETVGAETARDDDANAMEVTWRESASLVLELLMTTPAQNALVCLLAGAARMWWKWLPADKRREHEARAARWRTTLRAALAAGCGLFAAYIWSNTELDAATGRRRLFLYDDALLERKAEHDANQLVNRYRRCGVLVGPSSPVHRRAAGVTAALVRANGHVDAVRDRRWRVIVVDDPRFSAFVSINGVVFVDAGLVDDVNDDQLSIIVGHEMSHCVQRHINQTMSAQFVFDVAHLASAAVAWAVLPFRLALFTQALALAVRTVLLEWPLSRAMESEADRDGLMLAARACVDVAEGARYWRRRDQEDRRAGGKPDFTWWMSSHPSNSTRARRMAALVPEALELRNSVGCGTPLRAQPR